MADDPRDRMCTDARPDHGASVARPRRLRRAGYAQAIADVDAGRRVLACHACDLVRPWRGAADAERDGWTREGLRAPWRCPSCSAPADEAPPAPAPAAEPHAWLLAAAARDPYAVKRALSPMAERDRARFVELVQVVLAARPADRGWRRWASTYGVHPARTKRRDVTPI